jgi:hypothetical protein
MTTVDIETIGSIVFYKLVPVSKQIADPAKHLQ